MGASATGSAVPRCGLRRNRVQMLGGIWPADLNDVPGKNSPSPQTGGKQRRDGGRGVGLDERSLAS